VKVPARVGKLPPKQWEIYVLKRVAGLTTEASKAQRVAPGSREAVSFWIGRCGTGGRGAFQTPFLWTKRSPPRRDECAGTQTRSVQAAAADGEGGHGGHRPSLARDGAGQTQVASPSLKQGGLGQILARARPKRQSTGDEDQ